MPTLTSRKPTPFAPDAAAATRARGARLRLVLAGLGLLAAGPPPPAAEAAVSRPGGAGHALLFHDTFATIRDFADMPSTKLTFEAWISTTDECHPGTVLSYAVRPGDDDPRADRIRAFNNFVIWDVDNIVACHDFQFLTRVPDPSKISCRAQFVDVKDGTTASFVTKEGEWHHLAVTWDATKNGETKIYKDGLLVAQAQTGKTAPIPPGGTLFLGAEQDCFGGCTDAHQAFYGYMDEVRLWKSVRSQQAIQEHMRNGDQVRAPAAPALVGPLAPPPAPALTEGLTSAPPDAGRGGREPGGLLEV